MYEYCYLNLRAIHTKGLSWHLYRDMYREKLYWCSPNYKAGSAYFEFYLCQTYTNLQALDTNYIIFII